MVGKPHSLFKNLPGIHSFITLCKLIIYSYLFIYFYSYLKGGNKQRTIYQAGIGSAMRTKKGVKKDFVWAQENSATLQKGVRMPLQRRKHLSRDTKDLNKRII